MLAHVILHRGGTIKLDKFSGICRVKIFTHSDDYTGKTFYSPLMQIVKTMEKDPASILKSMLF